VAQSEEQSKNAKWEIRVHKLIGNDSPNLIPLIDSDISREKRGYEQILLLYPFFKKGSLVELLVRKAEQGGELPERDNFGYVSSNMHGATTLALA